VPGLIVREHTNGYYEIFIRGGENQIGNSFMPYFSNATTLVMIDSRPVYNYLQGGTFWETLPIDLNDVERIEVVRGALTASYGPNALSGVINIITRRPKNYTLYSVANAQYGSHNTLVANASVGYKWNRKFDITVSGNFQGRDRYQSEYYQYVGNQFENDSLRSVFGSLLTDTDAKFPNPKRSMDKYGINAFLNYQPVDKVSFSLSTGYQNSWAQRAFSENTSTPFTTAESNTYYTDLRASIHNLSAQFSYLTGKQSPALNTYGLTYDLSTMDAFIEYDFVWGGKETGSASAKNFGEFDVNFLPAGHSISLRPGVNFRKAIYDDTDYWHEGEGFINARGELNTFAVSAKLDYDIKSKFRFSTAFRVDRNNFPKDKNYTSNITAIKYHFNDKNIIRAAYSRAYRGVQIFDTYSNFNIRPEFGNQHYFFTDVMNPALAQQLMQQSASQNNGESQITYDQAYYIASHMWQRGYYDFQFSGNRDLDLMKSDMFEVGYRAKLGANFTLDVEVFHSITNDFVYPLIVTPLAEQVPVTTVVGMVNIPGIPQPQPALEAALVVENLNDNIPLKVKQTGVTVSANIVLGHVQIKPFVTYQQTRKDNYMGDPDSYFLIKDNPDALNERLENDVKHPGTPSWFGGSYINWRISPKLNLNVSPYFMSASTLVHDFNELRPPLSDGSLPEGTGKIDIPAKLLVNAKLGYRLSDPFLLFISARNLSAKQSKEYFYTDTIEPSFLVGASFEF
jgi:iron complex outermembrane recepter protein